MTQLHHITLLVLSLFLSLPLSLATTLPLTFKLSPSLAVPPPTPTQPLTLIDNSINTTSENSHDCLKTSPFAPARPLYNDCLSAIRLLPTSTDLGLFHTGASGDAYQLPRFETSGTCRLILGLDHTATHGEVGSWAGVGLDAGQLAVSCVQFGSLKDFYGGKTTTGANGLITIILIYSGTPGLGENKTEVASS